MPNPVLELVPRGKADIIRSLLKLFGSFFPEAETTWYAIPSTSGYEGSINMSQGHQEVPKNVRRGHGNIRWRALQSVGDMRRRDQRIQPRWGRLERLLRWSAILPHINKPSIPT